MTQKMWNDSMLLQLPHPAFFSQKILINPPFAWKTSLRSAAKNRVA